MRWRCWRRPTEPERRRPAATAVRAIRRRELFRVAAADVLGLVDLRDVEQALTTITAVTLTGALDIATRAVVGAPARAGAGSP